MAKKSSGGGGANWMDTYGDMVTLLLCFFVLLYSMSSIDTEKWKALVMSFNPNSVKDQTEIVGGNDGPSADAEPLEPDPDLTLDDLMSLMQQVQEEQGKIDEEMNNLYEQLQEYAEEAGITDSVEITKGDGYVFISFRDTVFFNGNSYVLRPDGIKVLKELGKIFDRAVNSIDEIQIMGNTAQARDDQPNKAVNDRLLAAERAAMAAAYIQQNTKLDPARIVDKGFGQHRPVAPNDKDNRHKNRRVEICVTGRDLLNELGDSIEQYYTMAGSGQAPSSAPTN